jgi:hypothetical protein
MSRARVSWAVGVVAAIAAFAAPSAAAAQGSGPFPDDNQPIADEYGLPPLDHPSQAGGGGAGRGGSAQGGAAGAGQVDNPFAQAAAGRDDGSLRVSDVRRGERQSRAAGGAGTRSSSRAGQPVPLAINDTRRTRISSAGDPRGGFDLVLLVLAGVAATALAVAAATRFRRPARPS